MRYELVISKDGKDEIIFNRDNGLDGKITKFEFKLNSINDDSPTRDRSARCEIRLEGDIDKSSYKEVIKLTQWSVIKNSNFREIKICVYDENENENMLLRTFELDNMFCIDCEEIWENNEGKFKISMAQAPNETKTDIFDF